MTGSSVDHSTHSDMSGSVVGGVVQARDIAGGVHIHTNASDTHHVPRPVQLPAAPRQFVDREEAFGHLDKLIGDDGRMSAAVFVVAGTAGVGKTALALRWAHEAQHRFPDGQLYVNLRGYGPDSPVDPYDALHRFLTALSVPVMAIPTDVEAAAALYRSLLAERSMLAVLDNAVSAAQVRPLLPGTDRSLALVTSRSRLSGLSVREGARRLTLDTLAETDAVTLLSTVTSDYRQGDDNQQLTELAGLCARLPLALCIAAERAATRPHTGLHELISGLRDESALWDELSVGDEEEAESVHSVFAWSYRALNPTAARLFRLLGLHPGPEFGSAAAAALAGLTASRARQLLDVLEGVHMVEQPASDRYAFHDLLRAYALDQAQAEEDPEGRRDALRRVLAWYLHGASAAQSHISPNEPHLPIAPLPDGLTAPVFSDHAEAMAWYEREHVNLLAAARAAENAGEDEAAWQLPAVLRSVHMILNPFREWTEMSEIGLRAARRVGNRQAEAELLEGLAMACTQSHRLVDGAVYHEANLELRRELGDRTGEAFALNDLALLRLRERRLDDAREGLNESLLLFRELGDEYWSSVVTGNLAEIHYQYGDLDRANDLARQALEVHVAMDSADEQGNDLRLLSDITLELGRPADALTHAEEAVRIARGQRNPMWEGYWLMSLGRSQVACGNATDALASFQQSAAIHRRLGDRSREAQACHGAGQVYTTLDQYGQAAESHRAAALFQRELGDSWQLALALDGLATALVGSGNADAVREANQHRREALDLVAEFPDPRARALGVRLRTLAEG